MTISVRGVIFGSRLPRYGVNFARRFTVKIEKPQPVAPETPRPEPPPLVDASNMLMITETWEEARARVMAEQAAKRNKEIAAAKARMEAQPKPVLNLMITETWEEARARRKANRLNLNGEDERRVPAENRRLSWARWTTSHSQPTPTPY